MHYIVQLWCLHNWFRWFSYSLFEESVIILSIYHSFVLYPLFSVVELRLLHREVLIFIFFTCIGCMIKTLLLKILCSWGRHLCSISNHPHLWENTLETSLRSNFRLLWFMEVSWTLKCYICMESHWRKKMKTQELSMRVTFLHYGNYGIRSSLSPSLLLCLSLSLSLSLCFHVVCFHVLRFCPWSRHLSRDLSLSVNGWKIQPRYGNR